MTEPWFFKRRTEVEAQGIDPQWTESSLSWTESTEGRGPSHGLGLRPKQRWTRLQPIRTVAEVEVRFAVFTYEPFRFQEIAVEVGRMRRLGMSLRAIGRAVGVDEKTVRKVLGRSA